MKLLTFAGRNTKEILRDPVNLAFGLGFPLVILFLLSAIQANVPVPMFEIGTLTPGVTVFGLSFVALSAALQVAKDRETALLLRLYTTPLTAGDFILGYILPMVPLALGQTLICYGAAFCLGLKVTVNLLYAVMLILPTSLLFIAMGVLFGSVLSAKQAGTICGAFLTNLAAWLSGTWFDVKLLGRVFEKIAYALPFVHAVELERAALAGRFQDILPHFAWVLGYTVVLLLAAVGLFLRQMKRQ